MGLENNENEDINSSDEEDININTTHNNNTNNNTNNNNNTVNNNINNNNYTSYSLPIDDNYIEVNNSSSNRDEIVIELNNLDGNNNNNQNNLFKSNNYIVVKNKLYLYTNEKENENGGDKQNNNGSVSKMIRNQYPFELSHLIGNYQFNQIIDRINQITNYSKSLYKWAMINLIFLGVVFFIVALVLKFTSHDGGVPISTIILLILSFISFIIFSLIPTIKINKRTKKYKKLFKELNRVYKNEGLVFQAKFDNGSKCSNNTVYSKELLYVSIEYPTIFTNNQPIGFA